MLNSFDMQCRRADAEVEIFVEYCDKILKKNLNQTSLGDISDKDGNKLWDVNFDGVGIIANESFTEFEVGHEVYYPGSYHEPDTTDYSEDGKYPTLREALWAVLTMHLQWDYNNWVESQWVEEHLTTLEEY